MFVPGVRIKESLCIRPMRNKKKSSLSLLMYKKMCFFFKLLVIRDSDNRIPREKLRSCLEERLTAKWWGGHRGHSVSVRCHS